jgi:hypothetical protein
MNAVPPRDDALPGSSAPAAVPALPAFYKRPWPVSVERHGSASLRPSADYRVARGVGSVPITISEFPLASRHYPIVFTGGAEPNAVAVLGINENENLFIDAAGKWSEGRYVPAYVRRYPFIFQEHPDGKNLTLCIDEACGLIEEKGNRPFYKDGRPTEVLQNALNFCVEYQKDWLATRRLAGLLKEAQLFSPHRAHLITRAGDVLEVAGFQVVTEETWAKVPDELVLALKHQNFLAALHAHFFSAQNWTDLVDRGGRGKRRRKRA